MTASRPTQSEPIACHEDMGSDPCGKPAVGRRLDPNHGSFYPVCAEHLRQPLSPERDAIERGAMALCQFVFPGSVVPRYEMAEAVLLAVSHNADPRVGIAKRIVPTEDTA